MSFIKRIPALLVAAVVGLLVTGSRFSDGQFSWKFTLFEVTRRFPGACGLEKPGQITSGS